MAGTLNYYNENDKHAAAWLLGLIEDGLIPKGHVDARSITEVRPADLVGYTQCHFFAGIGGWPLALRISGWPATRSIWTASCPCQPFSSAGKRKGKEDERHLWPVFAGLVNSCKPTVITLEQVASKLGRLWLSGVFADLEGMGYSRAGADLCSASVGSPNIRQRLYGLAYSECRASERQRFDMGEEATGTERQAHQRQWIRPDLGSGRYSGWLEIAGRIHQGRPAGCSQESGRRTSGESSGPGVTVGDAFGVADPEGIGRKVSHSEDERKACREIDSSSDSSDGSTGITGTVGVAQRLGDSNCARSQGRCQCGQCAGEQPSGSPVSFGHWQEFDVVTCRDGNGRRIPKGSLEPSLQRMVDGFSSGVDPLWHQGYPLAWEKIEGRVSLLKGIGNAINPYVAAEFLKACMEVIG